MLLRRRLSDLALDAIFFVWIAQLLVTGNVVPQPLLALFQSTPEAVVATEPMSAPEAPPTNMLPLLDPEEA